MKFEEYVKHDAVGLAALVKVGEVTASELLEIAISRAEAVNPQINALVYKGYEEGRKMLQNLPKDAPFRGVPFLLKDLGLNWANTPMRVGSRSYEGYTSPQDSEIVKKYRAAGLVFFGKTNTPEWGLTPYTESQLFGAARNPWNIEYSSGGSSGGSASAVSAGIVPAATASDGGGSIRIPASCCGLFGMKTSRGRTPLGDFYGEMWSGAVVENTVTRSVRDSAALLDAIEGETIGAPYMIPPPQRPYAQEVGRVVGKLRVAFSTEHIFGNMKIDDECITATKNTVKLLESLGHEVEEVRLPYDESALKEIFLMMILGEVAGSLREVSKLMNRTITRSDVELNTWVLAKIGEAYTAGEYAYAKTRWNELTRKMGHFMEKYDTFLTPTMSRPPIKVGELQNSTSENRLIKIVDTLGLFKFMKGGKTINDLAEKAFGYIPHTPITNMTGQPAMSVPLHWTQSGLPVGVMFVAKFGAEDLLYRLAGQLEQAQPWFNKRAAL